MFSCRYATVLYIYDASQSFEFSNCSACRMRVLESFSTVNVDTSEHHVQIVSLRKFVVVQCWLTNLLLLYNFGAFLLRFGTV